MPSYDFTHEEWNSIISYFQSKDGLSLKYENPHNFSKTSDSYKAGIKIQEEGACINCHFYGEMKPRQDADFAIKIMAKLQICHFCNPFTINPRNAWQKWQIYQNLMNGILRILCQNFKI